MIRLRFWITLARHLIPFSPDGINSVGDYNSTWVGIVCLSCFCRVCPHFLDAFTHLYKRLCPSMGPSVRGSVRQSLRNPLTKNAITARKLKETSEKHQGTHRIAFLVEIQENSAKFKKIQENSAIYWTHLCSNWTCFHLIFLSLFQRLKRYRKQNIAIDRIHSTVIKSGRIHEFIFKVLFFWVLGLFLWG